MRAFTLMRDEDITGISGTGVVAEGVEFDDGSCAMRWRTGKASTAVYSSVDDVIAIHGHGGSTRLVWADEADAASDDAGLGVEGVNPDAVLERIDQHIRDSRL